MDTWNDVISYRIPDACRVLGVGRTTLYSLIKEGYLTAISVGRRRLVTRASLEAFVEGASSRA